MKKEEQILKGYEYGCACNKCGCNVNGECDKEYDSTDNLKGLLIRSKAVGKILGNGDGVACCNGELSQSLCTENPVCRGAQCKSDAYPDLAEAECEDGAGQTHEQPG